MTDFIPGQRWISNTEIQLGLSTIVDTDHRTVSIYFAAGDETRTYARTDAPLTRIIYTPGEIVNTVAGQSVIIDMVYQVPGLLLLTATPEQLGIASHFALLHLLDPDRFPDLDTFVQEEQGYQHIAHAIDALLGNEAFDNTTHRLLEQVLLEQPATQTVSENKPIQTALKQLAQNNNNQEQQQVRQWLIQHMLNRHGTGRVLFRNTRSAIQCFPKRQVFFHPQPLPDDYEQCIVQFSQELKTQSENDQADFFPAWFYIRNCCISLPIVTI